jgi:DNA-binding transcriptional LysR family regulator
LRDFQAAHPRVSTEIRVSNTGVLLQDMARGELDLVVGSRCHGDRIGRLLWREPLVWAYARGATPSLVAAIPLAFFPEPCPYRDAALAALGVAGRESRIALVSPSVGSLRAAAAAAFAVTPLSRSLLTPQLHALGPDAGLPDLPDVEFIVVERTHDCPGEVGELTGNIVQAAGRF